MEQHKAKSLIGQPQRTSYTTRCYFLGFALQYARLVTLPSFLTSVTQVQSARASHAIWDLIEMQAGGFLAGSFFACA
jgi:hypothetical protein